MESIKLKATSSLIVVAYSSCNFDELAKFQFFKTYIVGSTTINAF